MSEIMRPRSACCGPAPLSESDSPQPPPFISKLKSASSVARLSTDSQMISTESVNNYSRKKDNQRTSSEFDFKNIDHSPDNLLLYQVEIARKCSDRCPTRKNFTADIAKKYFEVQTSKRIDLATILSVKITYPEAPCPYAIDAESYSVFPDFFMPLISDLQNGAEIVDSCQGLNFGDSEALEELDLNADKEVLQVMYCEIIVRRNMNDYNLAGCLKMEHKLAVRDILKSKCRELFAALSPVTLPSEWVARLKLDEPYLFESRAMNHYPKGRLNIAYKDDIDCTIGSIINYDDHLQIVLSTNNGKIGHLFNQTNKIFNSTVMSKMEFMKHQKLGYITYSPRYLGTGFTIRLIMRVYFVCLMDDVDDIYLRDLGLEFKNHDDPTKGLGVLSNRRTMGLMEIEIFQNILEGFRRIFELDQELKNTCPNSIIDRTMPVESLISLVTKIYHNESARTYTKKYLTEIIAHQYDNIPTTFNGLFNHCIRANAFYGKSLFPKACDPDCYAAFSRFFNPILLEANHCRQFLHNSNPNYSIAHTENRYKFTHELIKGYRVRFSRNLEDYAFPMLTSAEERNEIELKMIEAFSKFPEDICGTYLKLDNIVETEEFNFLVDLKLIPKQNNPVKRASWVYRDWPKNRGIFVANKSPNYPNNILIIIVNEVDHFQVSCINYRGERLDCCYDRAVLAMKSLDLHFNSAYAKKPNYGFLSSNPANVGCSMRISAKILLKYLGSDRVILNEFCILNNMNYRGINGSGSCAEDNIFDVSLKLNLNYSEIQILMIFIQRLKDLILEERRYDHTIPKPGNYQIDRDSPATPFKTTLSNGKTSTHTTNTTTTTTTTTTPTSNTTTTTTTTNTTTGSEIETEKDKRTDKRNEKDNENENESTDKLLPTNVDDLS